MDNGGMLATGGIAVGGIPAAGIDVDGKPAAGAAGGKASRIVSVFFSSGADFFCLPPERLASTAALGCEAVIGGAPIETFAPTPRLAAFPEFAAPLDSLPVPRWAGTGMRTVWAFALLGGFTWNRFWQ